MMSIKFTQKTYSKLFSWFVIFAFLANMIMPTPGFAQSLSFLPAPGAMVTLTPSFSPVLLRGVRVNPENPFELDFIVDVGDTNLNDEEFKKESEKLIKYFLASLTIPESDLWVNLSPYEEDRIIPDAFSQTEMGRDLLAQDYILKQITASLIYPEDELGKQFWSRVYKQAFEQYGTTQIPVNTFNKVWIVPQKAVVYENGPHAFVVKSHLKVMLEEDYLSLENNLDNRKIGTQKDNEDKTKQVSNLSSQIVREVVLPEIEKEVNNGKNFASLRQIYNSLILAVWFKNTLKDSILNQKYSNQAKISGVDVEDKQVREKIYNQYLDAFKKGVCDLVKVEYDQYSNSHVPRKYFSGGFFLGDTQDTIDPTDDIGQVSAACSPAKLRVVSSTLKNPGQDIKERKRYLISRQFGYSAFRGVEDYDWWFNEAGLRFQEANTRSPLDLFLRRFTNDYYRLKRGRPLRVLDAGCGAGVMLTGILKKYGESVEVYGIDLNNINAKTMTPEALKVFVDAQGQEMASEYLSEEKLFHFKQGDIKTTKFFNEDGTTKKMDLIMCNFVLQYDENPLSGWINLFRQLVPGGTFVSEITFPYTKEGTDVLAFYNNLFDQMKLAGINVRKKEKRITRDPKKGIEEIALFVSVVREEEQRIIINAKPLDPIPIKTILEEENRDYEYNLVPYVQTKENLVTVSSPTLASSGKGGVDDKIVLSQIYEGMKESLDPVYTSISRSLFRSSDDNQGAFTILGIGYGVSNFLKDIKQKFKEKVSIWTNDKEISDEYGAFLDQPSNVVEIIDNGFERRADKVISLIDCRDNDKDIFNALQEWKNAFDQIKVGGHVFSSFVFSKTEKGAKNQKLLIDLLSLVREQNHNIRFLQKTMKTESGDEFYIVYCRAEKQVESEIEVSYTQESGNNLKIYKSLTKKLTSNNVQNIFSRLGPRNLTSGLRIRVNDSIDGGFNPKIHKIYGVKALVNSKTKEVVFFSQSDIGSIQPHEDVAKSYFGKLSGDILGYQLQLLLNSETNEVSVIGAQVDSKLMRMPELYRPERGGKQIVEQGIIDANKILFDGISIEKMFDSELDIEVHEDFLPFISDAKTLPGSDEKILQKLKIYKPSLEIKSVFFKNPNNRDKFEKLFIDYVKAYFKNLDIKHKLDQQLQENGLKIEDDKDFFKREFYGLSSILAYGLIKSFFSRNDKTQKEFKLFLKDVRDFMKMTEENSQKKEVSETRKRILNIFSKYINDNSSEILNVATDTASIIIDPGFAFELDIDRAIRRDIIHDIKNTLHNIFQAHDYLKEQMENGDALESDDEVILLQLFRFISRSRKAYHDFFNFRVFDQNFKLGGKTFQIVGFTEFSNPKEVRKVEKPFRGEMFDSFWPEKLKESEYIFSLRDIDEKQADDGEPIALVYFTKVIKPVIVSGRDSGAVSFLKEDDVEDREVYNIRRISFNPGYGEKLKQTGYTRVQFLQIFIGLVAQWATEQSPDQNLAFLYDSINQRNHQAPKKIFGVQEARGADGFLTSTSQGIKEFLRQNLKGVVITGQRNNEIQPEDVVFEYEFEGEEGSEGNAPVDYTDIVINRSRGDLVHFAHQGKRYLYSRADDSIQSLDPANPGIIDPEKFNEIHPKLIAAMEAGGIRISSGITLEKNEAIAPRAAENKKEPGAAKANSPLVPMEWHEINTRIAKILTGSQEEEMTYVDSNPDILPGIKIFPANRGEDPGMLSLYVGRKAYFSAGVVNFTAFEKKLYVMTLDEVGDAKYLRYDGISDGKEKEELAERDLPSPVKKDFGVEGVGLEQGAGTDLMLIEIVKRMNVAIGADPLSFYGFQDVVSFKEKVKREDLLRQKEYFQSLLNRFDRFFPLMFRGRVDQGSSLRFIINEQLRDAYDANLAVYDKKLNPQGVAESYKGEISISFNINEENLVISIFDNGIGDLVDEKSLNQRKKELGDDFYIGGEGRGRRLSRDAMIALGGRIERQLGRIKEGKKTERRIVIPLAEIGIRHSSNNLLESLVDNSLYRFNNFLRILKKEQLESVGLPNISDAKAHGVGSSRSLSSNNGGIDLGADTLDMEVQSQGERFEFGLDAASSSNIEINGLYPVIINVAPVTNLPAFLGAADQDEQNLQLSYAN